MATAILKDAVQQGDPGEAADLLKRWGPEAAYAAFAGLAEGAQADVMKLLRAEGEQGLREQLVAAAGAAAAAPPPPPSATTCTYQLAPQTKKKTHHQGLVYVSCRMPNVLSGAYCWCSWCTR